MTENPIQMFTNRLNWAPWADEKEGLLKKDIKINRVQIENNFRSDFILVRGRGRL